MKKKNTSKPPRTREGQEFPGGKTLRKRLAKLKARQNAPEGIRHDHRKAGSMK